VYLTLNNIDKLVRRKLSSRAHVLIGYLPVSKFRVFKPSSRLRARQQFFHDCMSRIMHPLVEAGTHGVKMTCADGLIRLVFPILSCYVADAPEQARVTCVKENHCPKCPVAPNERGEQLFPDYTGRVPLRDQGRAAYLLRVVDRSNVKTPAFKREGFRSTDHPFWADLPHTNIFMAITPDILHQLHNGLVGEHVVPWLQDIIKHISEHELDDRLRAMSPYPGLRYFRDGLLLISQWTGNERRELEKILLGCLVDLVPHNVFQATSALLDVVYYMRFESHDTDSLAALQDAIDSFHSHKHAFVELGIRNHFNFAKFHSLQHYVDSLRLFGSADGYSTDISERLHIDLAKNAYRATNRRDFFAQMVLWLQRREKMAFFAAYQTWFDEQEAARSQARPEAAHRPDAPKDDVPRGAIVGPHSTYLLAKAPSTRNVSLETIVSDTNVDNTTQGGHHATHFVDALNDYLHSVAPADQAAASFSDNDKICTYRQVTMLVRGNPQTGKPSQRERIRAVTSTPAGSGRYVASEVFSTVLVHVDEPNPATEGTVLQGAHSAPR
jgi:hypothetical protein